MLIVIPRQATIFGIAAVALLACETTEGDAPIDAASSTPSSTLAGKKKLDRSGAEQDASVAGEKFAGGAADGGSVKPVDASRPNEPNETGTNTPVARDGGVMPKPPEPAIGVCKSDKTCASEGKLCDQKRQVCVACILPSDCGEGALCVDSECVSVTHCQSSLQCGTDRVCVKAPGAADGACFECGRKEDCASDQVCANNTCVLACASDKACAPSGELCDIAAGYCAECVGTAGCSGSEYCEKNTCHEKVCTPGVNSCLGNDVVTCNAVGSGYEPPRSCGNYPCENGAEGGAGSYPPSVAPPNALNKNGDFAAEGTGWSVQRGVVSSPAMPVDGQICATGSQTLQLGWPADPADSALLTLGAAYTLKFRSVTARNAVSFPVVSITAKVGAPIKPFTTYGFKSFTPADGLTENEFSFVMTQPTTSAGINLTLQVNQATVCVSDIWLVPAPAAAP